MDRNSYRRNSTWRALTLSLLGLHGLVPSIVAAAPVDLFDDQPRMIRVAFEISPQDRPAQIDATYSAWFPAWLEPGARAGEVVVRVDGEIVEQHLLADQAPVPGSFSDFVWTFDAATGHVISAQVRGKLVRTLDWGLARTRTTAEIAIAMSTARESGFRAPTRLLGQLIYKHCTRGGGHDCTLVAPSQYDAATGYVNAVGELRVLSSVVDLTSFSPLGEAIFSEAEGWEDPISRDASTLAGSPGAMSGTTESQSLPSAHLEPSARTGTIEPDERGQAPL